MVSCLHNRVKNTFLAPNLSLPVTNRQEILNYSWVAFKSIDRTVMFTLWKAKSKLSLNSLSFHNIHDVALLCTNQKFVRTSFCVVFHWSTSQNLYIFVFFGSEVVFKNVLFNWFAWLSHIPPKNATISWCWNAFFSSFACSKPIYVINWVMVRIF